MLDVPLGVIRRFLRIYRFADENYESRRATDDDGHGSFEDSPVMKNCYQPFPCFNYVAGGTSLTT